MLKKLYSGLIAASLLLAMNAVYAQGGMGGEGRTLELTEAAETLGLTEEELREALGTPPDFAAAAETLGITREELRAAMPAREGKGEGKGGGGMGGGGKGGMSAE